MRNLRYWVRFLTTFSNKFKGLLFLSIILGVAFFLFLFRFSVFFLTLGSGETVGLVGRFTIDDMPLVIKSNISMGLTTFGEDNSVLPGLAQSWISEEEGKVWVFKLGEHTWQDGSIVRATDVNYNFSDVMSEIIDQQTIRFILKDPFAPFPSIVSRPVFKRGLLGNGEWKVEKLNLANNGRFLETIKLVHVKDPQVKTYHFYPTEEAARTALKLGEVDQLQDIVDLQELVHWKNLQIKEKVRLDRYAGIFINNFDPILSDKSLRQALAYAIDKDKLFSEGKIIDRAISPISPQSWAYNPQVKQYLYNPKRAKELIATLPKNQRENLVLKLVTTPSLLPIADKIGANWKDVGIQTQIQVSNTPPEDFQTLLAIQIIPSDPDQYSFWHSSQTATNLTRYKDSKESQRIDKLLEDGRRILDQEERVKIYQDFQRFLVEDSPVIFLYHPLNYTISRK